MDGKRKRGCLVVNLMFYVMFCLFFFLRLILSKFIFYCCNMAMSQTEKEQKGVFHSDYHPDQNPVPDVEGQENADIPYPIDFNNKMTPVTCLLLNRARLDKDKIYIDDRQLGMLQLVASVESISCDGHTWCMLLQDDHSKIMARYFVTGEHDYWLANLRDLQFVCTAYVSL